MKLLSLIGGIAFGLLVFARSMADESRDQNIKAERVIALSEIVSTSSQPGLKHASDSFRDDGVFEHPYGYHLQQIVLGSKSGASNVFLVDATNIDDAVRAASEVLLGARAATTPAPVDSRKPVCGSHWLVVYLGAGHSGPPKYVVKAASVDSVDSSQIRLSYHEPSPRRVTRNIHRYYYWIPIGKLSDGVYKLELYDTELKEVTLMRRVDVKQSR